MNYLEETKRLLRDYRVRPRRSLGQNFCLNGGLMERMITYASLGSDDTVLEIGSGFGFLTRHLSEVAKMVIAVEVDHKLLKVLRENLKNRENVRIVSGDVLKVELPGFNKVVSNPPYSLSLHLIMFLFKRNFDLAILTLQKEFAEKLIAQVGKKEYGPLAVIADYKARVEILEHLPHDLFYPQPNVESVVILIKIHKPKFNVIDEELFFEAVGYLFTQRNRKVKKPLESFLLKKIGIGKAEARLIIESLPFVETRVSDVKPEEFGALTDKIHPFLRAKRITCKDHSFYVFPEVYEPSDDTFLMAEHLHAKESETVLDMGTGCGLIGILAAGKAARIVEVDVNPYALQCVKFNTKLNQVADKVDIVLSDMFSGFKTDAKFDFIVFNPPYLPVDETIIPGEWLEKAWYGGRSGREVIDRFLNDVDEHVIKGGRVLMVQSSLSNLEESVKMFKKKGFKTEVIAEKELFFEKIVVIQAEKLIQ